MLACHWLLKLNACLSLAEGAQTPKISAQEASRKNMIFAPLKCYISTTILEALQYILENFNILKSFRWRIFY